eukprot:5776720-Amphidinium_carterae.2
MTALSLYLSLSLESSGHLAEVYPRCDPSAYTLQAKPSNCTPLPFPSQNHLTRALPSNNKKEVARTRKQAAGQETGLGNGVSSSHRQMPMLKT